MKLEQLEQFIKTTENNRNIFINTKHKPVIEDDPSRTFLNFQFIKLEINFESK